MPINFLQMGCGCNIFFEDIGGGILCGGEADESSSRIEVGGTILCGGTAYVDVAGDVWDGMEFVYHLQEQGIGTDEEYIDSSPNELHGTGGSGVADYCPTREDGIFCLYAQTFDATNDFISIPQDTLQDQDFALSFWGKLDSFYAQNTILGRGTKDNLGNTVFSVGHSVMRHIHAQFNLNDDGTADEIFDAFSATTLDQSKWYHIAVSFDHIAKRVDVYLNGTLDNTNDSTSTAALATLKNDGVIGKTNQTGFQSVFSAFGNSGFFEGSLMEIRFHPEKRNEAWWAAEYNNWCSGNFVLIGEEETSTLPIT